jgi:hypothetical protein
LRTFAGISFLAALLCAGATAPQQAAINRISADSMRGNLSFLASDALEGRATPSRGLAIAAEFIASRFRRAGLEPVGQNYFQTADQVTVTPKLDDFRMTLAAGGDELELSSVDATVRSLQGIDMKNAPVIDLCEAGASACPPMPDISGKIVAGDARKYGSEPALAALRAAKPAIVLLVEKASRGKQPAGPWQGDAADAATPIIRIFNEDAAAAVADGRAMTLSIHLAPPVRSDAKSNNVLGLLPGSDLALRGQYVIVSAHYDHLGIKGGRIYNGANDDGSGVVSVIEIASALASLEVRPKRSILFAAFFGEEEGLLGSRYYTHHPAVPLSATVANINLEQMGRTDEQDGREVGAFAFTGPSFSDLPSAMTAAARAQGVKVYNKRGADSFFDRSDNYPFAQAGVVAHTVVVAFEFPDYHAPGDKWEKIDYGNMAAVDRAIAAGILQISDAAQAPKWTRK